MSMFNDILWGTKDNEQECIANVTLVLLFAKRFRVGRWSFLRLGSAKKWYSIYNERSRGEWDRVAEFMMITFRESGRPVFRVTSPLSRGTLKSKGREKWSIHLCVDGTRLELFFAQLFLSISSASTELSQICVKNTKACHIRTGRLELTGQSVPLFESTSSLMKTPTLSLEFLFKKICCKKYKERVDRLSQQNQLTKMCIDAGFLKTVGRTVLHEKAHWRVLTIYRNQWHVASTLCHEMKKSTDLKGWIRRNTKIGPVLEVTTSYLQGKYGVEIKIESLDKNNSHSWVRISHGLNKLVTDLFDTEFDDNEQETSKTKAIDICVENGSICFCKSIKG